jgi:hypothetical protein
MLVGSKNAMGKKRKLVDEKKYLFGCPPLAFADISSRTAHVTFQGPTHAKGEDVGGEY